MMESSSGTVELHKESPGAPCLASAKPIISRPMQRATHKTDSTGENRGNGEGKLCSLRSLLFNLSANASAVPKGYGLDRDNHRGGYRGASGQRAGADRIYLRVVFAQRT